MSDAMQALYDGDTERAATLLRPDDQLDVFHAAAFGRIERLRALLATEPAQANAFSADGRLRTGGGKTPAELAANAELRALLVARGGPEQGV